MTFSYFLLAFGYIGLLGGCWVFHREWGRISREWADIANEGKVLSAQHAERLEELHDIANALAGKDLPAEKAVH